MSRPAQPRSAQQKRIAYAMNRRPIVDFANSIVKYAADNMVLHTYEIGSDYRLRLDATEGLATIFRNGITNLPTVSRIDILNAIGDSIKNGGYLLQFRYDLCITFFQMATEIGIDYRVLLDYVISPKDKSDIFAMEVVDSAIHTIRYPNNISTFRYRFNQEFHELMQRYAHLQPETIVHSIGNRIGTMEEPMRTQLCEFFQTNSGINGFDFLNWVRRISPAPARVLPTPKPLRS
jgi:hypothetical protein